MTDTIIDWLMVGLVFLLPPIMFAGWMWLVMWRADKKYERTMRERRSDNGT